MPHVVFLSWWLVNGGNKFKIISKQISMFNTCSLDILTLFHAPPHTQSLSVGNLIGRLDVNYVCRDYVLVCQDYHSGITSHQSSNVL